MNSPVDPEPTDSATLPTTISEGFDDGLSFESARELAELSEMVIVGEVVAAESAGTPDAGEDPNADEYLSLTVKTVQGLRGDPPSTVLVVWDAFVTDGAGGRLFEIVANGIGVPELGDRYLLFLRQSADDRIEIFKGKVTHDLISLRGIYTLDGDVVRGNYLGHNPAQDDLNGRTISEIAQDLASP